MSSSLRDLGTLTAIQHCMTWVRRPLSRAARYLQDMAFLYLAVKIMLLVAGGCTSVLVLLNQHAATDEWAKEISGSVEKVLDVIVLAVAYYNKGLPLPGEEAGWTLIEQGSSRRPVAKSGSTHVLEPISPTCQELVLSEPPAETLSPHFPTEAHSAPTSPLTM